MRGGGVRGLRSNLGFYPVMLVEAERLGGVEHLETRWLRGFFLLARAR